MPELKVIQCPCRELCKILETYGIDGSQGLCKKCRKNYHKRVAEACKELSKLIPINYKLEEKYLSEEK